MINKNKWWMIDNRYKHYYSLVLARTTQLRRYRGHVIIYRLGGGGGFKRVLVLSQWNLPNPSLGSVLLYYSTTKPPPPSLPPSLPPSHCIGNQFSMVRVLHSVSDDWSLPFPPENHVTPTKSSEPYPPPPFPHIQVINNNWSVLILGNINIPTLYGCAQ